jgi:hypothetical protein
MTLFSGFDPRDEGLHLGDGIPADPLERNGQPELRYLFSVKQPHIRGSGDAERGGVVHSKADNNRHEHANNLEFDYSHWNAALPVHEHQRDWLVIQCD